MKLYYLTLLFAFTLGASAQNFVPNPSFEDTLKPKCNYIQTPAQFRNTVKDWFLPTLATSDYFSETLPIQCVLHPSSTASDAIGRQKPRTGAHMTGLISHGYSAGLDTLGQSIVSYREYISVRLQAPLKVGKVYEVEMYVSRADFSAYAVGYLGMHFSINSLADYSHFSILEYSPQIVEPKIIADTTNWVKISGRFKACSPYEYLTIGNFAADTLISRLGFADTNGAECYYFIDDVLVQETRLEISCDNIICEGDSIELTSFGESITGWAVDSAPSILISTKDTITVAPNKPTTYLLITQGDTFSILVEVLPKYELELGNDTIICIGETFKTQVPVTVRDITWQNGSRDSVLTISESGTYWVLVNDYCGSFTDTIKVDFIDCSISLEMPNVFSPNNDGVNEFFKPIRTYGIGEGQLLIFNRNGEQVYESDLISTQWDGTHNNMNCVEGVYYWVASYGNILNEQKVRKGFLTLVR